MKRNMLMALFLVLALGLFANGNSENQNNSKQFQPLHEEILEGETPTILTGQVVFQNRIHPELKVGNKTYLLMVGPVMHRYPEDLKEGQEISVEGYVLNDALIEKLKKAHEDNNYGRAYGPMMGFYDQAAGDSTLVIVEAVTINGERIELDHDQYGGRMMGGPRGKGNFKGHHMM